MAHEAKLSIEGNDYSVIDCKYEFTQPIKENGQPAGYPTGGIIHVTVVSPDDHDTLLHAWMQSSIEHKDGTITFAVVGSNVLSKIISKKTVKFERGYCIGLQEHFSTHNEMQMVTKLTISAKKIKFGSLYSHSAGYSADTSGASAGASVGEVTFEND